MHGIQQPTTEQYQCTNNRIKTRSKLQINFVSLTLNFLTFQLLIYPCNNYENDAKNNLFSHSRT